MKSIFLFTKVLFALYLGIKVSPTFCAPKADQFDLNIQAQSLEDALLALQRNTGIAVIFSDRLVKVNSSESISVSGRYNVERAIDLILEDSGYHYLVKNRVYVIKKIPPKPKVIAPRRIKSPPFEEVFVIGKDVFPVDSSALITQQKIRAENFVDIVIPSQYQTLKTFSLADTMMYLPGVTPEYSFGRARKIGLRGLSSDHTVTTINGREFATTLSRGATLSLFGSELFEKINVNKSVQAGMLEGGIAGSIDLQTVRPLNYKKSIFRGQWQLEHNTLESFNDDTDFGRQGSFLLVDQFRDNTLGVAYAYSARRMTTPLERSFIPPFTEFWVRNWTHGRLLPNGQQMLSYGSRLPSGDSEAENDPLFNRALSLLGFPSGRWVKPRIFHLSNIQIDEYSDSHSLTIQWQPNLNHQFKFDFHQVNSKPDRDQKLLRIMTNLDANLGLLNSSKAKALLDKGSSDGISDINQLSDASLLQLANTRLVNNIEPVILNEFNSVDYFHIQYPQQGRNDFISTSHYLNRRDTTSLAGLNYTFTQNAHRLQLDLSKSISRYYQRNISQQVSRRSAPGVSANTWLRYDQRDRLFPSITFSPDLVQKESYQIRQGPTDQTRLNEDDLSALRLDYKYTKTHYKFSAGIRYAGRNRTNVQRRFSLLDLYDVLVDENLPSSVSENVLVKFVRENRLSYPGQIRLSDLSAVGLNIQEISSFTEKEITKGGQSSWLSWDSREFMRLIPLSEISPLTYQDPDNSNDWGISEDSFAAYTGFNLDYQVGQTKMSSSLGLRAVRTKQTIIQAVTPASIYLEESPSSLAEQIRPDLLIPSSIQLQDPLVILSDDSVSIFLGSNYTRERNEFSYTDYLPYLNTTLALNSNAHLRISADRVLSRANLQSLSGDILLEDMQGELDEGQIFFPREGGRTGNPFLSPVRANQYQFGLIYANAPTTRAEFNYFYKDIDSYDYLNVNRRAKVELPRATLDITNQEVINAVTSSIIENREITIEDLLPGISVSDNGESVAANLLVDSSTNGYPSSLWGLEFSTVQNLNIKPLPDFLQNIKLSFNYVYTEFSGSEQSTAIYDPQDFNNNLAEDIDQQNYVTYAKPSRFSKHQISNSIQYIDTKFSFGLFYRKRSEFNLTPAYWQAARTQIDLGLRYHFNSHLSARFQVYNLLNEGVLHYYTNPIDDKRNNNSNLQHLPESLRQYAGSRNGYTRNLPRFYEPLHRRFVLGFQVNF